MDYTASEVLQFVNENDVKFVRLAFCDIFGTPKNISILSSQLEKAFSEGIAFDASKVTGFMNIEESDLYLFPDPRTLSILPWRPQQGRVVRLYCEIKHPDGRAFDGDCRYLLELAVEKAKKMGYTCQVSPECEFYLFLKDENGECTKIPHDRAGYLDVAPLDRGENVRREICLTLEQMGIIPETSHHEKGPGQNEIVFENSDALTAADNLCTFKNVVKTVAMRNGLFASFMPRPLDNAFGSGLHINIFLEKNGVNIFKNAKIGHSPEAESFIAGVINRMLDITAFLNPIVNSYTRLGQKDAPGHITWSYDNMSPLIRIPSVKGDYTRMELRSPDPSCNPYIAFALILYAGLEGIEKKSELSKPYKFSKDKTDEDLDKELTKLPNNLGEALEYLKGSEFTSSIMPKVLLEKYIEQKSLEWEQYKNAETLADKNAVEYDAVFPLI